MTDAMSPRMKSKLGKYAPKVRDNCEALPNTYNVLKAPKYKPEPTAPVRPGADDHLKCKSKGIG